MSASDDSHAGTNAGRIQGQIAKISNWMDGADFEHVPGNDLDRLLAQVDWHAEIDPTLSASANYRIIKDTLGLKTATDIKEAARTADDRARQAARDALRRHVDAIEAGDAAELVQDIRAEYGAAFVDETLAAARQDRDAPAGGAPEPNDHNPSAVANANRTAETADAVEATHAPEPEPATAQASLADAAPTREPASPATPDTPVSPRSPGFSGMLGKAVGSVKLVLIVAYVLLMAPLDATDPEVTRA